MNRKVSLRVIFAIVLISMLVATFRVQKVNASGTIYIRANGMIEPKEAPISTVDNVTYTLIGYIYDSIVVERDNILVDGADYSVQGIGSRNGISLEGRRNVTIQNVEIIAFYNGVYLDRSLNNCISRNKIIANTYCGISLSQSSNNSIIGNNITSSNDYGIYVTESADNNITKNVFTKVGLFVNASYGNSVKGNFVNGKPLVYLEGVSDYAVGNAGQVILVNCDNVSVENLSLTDTTVGLELWGTKNCRIASNSIANNWYGIRLIESLNNSLVENSIIGSVSWGVWFDSSSNNSMIGNNIAYHYTGVWFSSSSDNKVIGNNITENKHWGFVLHESLNNSICQNNITNNKDDEGISLYGYSNHNEISENCIAGNHFNGITLLVASNNSIVRNNVTANNNDGIMLDLCSNCNSIFGNSIEANRNYGIGVLNSSNNSIVENEIKSNDVGVSVSNSSKNKFYHNNFIDNTFQVYDYSWNDSSILPSINVWDDGYPSGGNCWSDYNGTDFYYGSYQNITGSDGIGDKSHFIDAYNNDQYPLMGMFSDFPVNWAGRTYNVMAICNSTISDFSFGQVVVYPDHTPGPPWTTLIIFKVTGDTPGFCRIMIPKDILDEEYIVSLDGLIMQPSMWKELPISNDTTLYLYLTYPSDSHEIWIMGYTVVTELPSFLVLSLFMIATLFVVVVYKRKNSM